MPRKLYLDESGDLGWNFSSPYRKGGSSRYLTIAYLIVPKDKSHIPKRLVKNIYNEFKVSKTLLKFRGSDQVFNFNKN